MIFSLLRKRVGPSLAGWACVLVLSVLAAGPVRATHIRAGDIQAKSDTTAARNPLRIFFKMITYTDRTSPADQNNTEVIFFGDGTNVTATRVGGAGRDIGNNINRNVYYFEHTYSAPGRYTISHIGENRQSNIRNVPSSADRNFYIYTLITIDPVLGVNRSPVLSAPAVDRAARGQVFLHNPAAFDADGDSLAFKLRTNQWVPQGVQGTVNAGNRPQPVNLPGYQSPVDPSYQGVQVPFAGPPAGAPGSPAILDLNVRTGQLVWNSPGLLGEYNLAFVVEEWRRNPNGGRRLIGEVLRDMQVTVIGSTNNRPILMVPRDTCVVAGATITRTISATDADNNLIRLTAFGGIFPPATFQQTVNQPGRAAGVFNWTTDCNNVASEPTQVVFRAEDQPNSGVPLVDLRPWRITVVGPPPTNLRAAPAGNTVQLNWDQYFCPNAARMLIYRKENTANWTPGACEPGIPDNLGYVRVGSVPAGQLNFLDDNGGRGLNTGTYCYRIYAEFPRPAGGASIASREVCVAVRGQAISVPCPPVLAIQPLNCDSLAAANPRGQLTYNNFLSWTLGNTPPDCGKNISYYRVLYRATEEGEFAEIGRTQVPSYVHRNLASAAGCYAVIAVDSAGTSSAQSNVVCQDNCQIFVLPNIFTPNGDGKNDTFRPIFASPISRAKVQVFNRWGAKVYEGTASPDLTLWEGGGATGGEGQDTGAKVSAGTYYYLIEVEFANQARTTRSYKGWVEVTAR